MATIKYTQKTVLFPPFYLHFEEPKKGQLKIRFISKNRSTFNELTLAYII